MKKIKILSSAVLIASTITPVAFADNTVSADSTKFKDVQLYNEEINFLVEKELIYGYPDGTFKPYHPITRLQAITILLRDLKPNSTNIPDVNYKDVKKGDYGYTEIALATTLGIVSGKPDGTFDSTGNLTRAQFAKILVETYKIPLNKDKKVSFTDVGDKDWYSEYVQILASHGIILGYEDKSFKPNQTITRAHFVLMLSRFLKNKENILNGESSNEGSGNKPNVDTDGDGLNDYFEYKSKKYSPTLADTDWNGVKDGDEDADLDGLTNSKEIERGTNAFMKDTDGDGLLDGEEVMKGTNPLADDSDYDGLLDSEEDGVTFNPLNPDTDGDGIQDGDEVIEVEIKAPAYLQNGPAYASAILKSEAKNAFNTEIKPISTAHPILNNSIPGLIGNAYSFNTKIDFDTAKIKFHYDDSMLTNNSQPDIYYYNEEKKTLEKVPNQKHDPVTNTVTATVNHFSDYVLVDSSIWEQAWKTSVGIPNVKEAKEDSDGDGIPDYYEINGLISGTGSLIKTDPNNSDTDHDGILDGDEIKFNKDKNYVTLISDPNREDSDGDGILDSEEKSGEALVYNVTDDALAVFSDLAYIDVENHATSKEQAKELETFSKNVSPIPLSKPSIQKEIRLKNKANLVKDWEIIGYEVGEINGHYGIVFRNSFSNDIVIAERGKGVDNFASIATNGGYIGLDVLLEGDMPLVDHALALTRTAIYNNLYSDIFVTGHSLGGFNAQVISYHLINKTLAKNSYLSSKKSQAIHNAVNDHYQKTVTFNAAPLFNKDSLRQLGLNMDVYLNPEIPVEEIGKELYKNYITNYQISYDILTMLGQYLKAGYIGKNVMLNYPQNAPKTVNDSPLDDFKALLEEFKKFKYTDIAGNYMEPTFNNREELLSFLTSFYVWAQLNKKTEFDRIVKNELFGEAGNAHGIHFFDDYDL